MKYKAGDKVRIKSIDWYNENKDKNGNVYFEGGRVKPCFSHCMSIYCGQIMTISDAIGQLYHMIEDDGRFCWDDEMIEGLVEDEMPLDKAGQITDFEYEGLAYTLPDGYIFKDENGNVINATKIVLEKKKPEYPKTYEECCEIVGFGLKWDNPFRINRDTHPYMKHLDKLMRSLCKLLICRDAYWKIEGDWKPDYDSGVDKFGICTYDGVVQKSNAVSHWERHLNKVLEFPTKEMRDAFYENFKEFIEECKEFL